MAVTAPSSLIVRGDALNLPIADASVDLVVTSPPYFALRSYTDGGEHYDGQIGSEPTPGEFIETLLRATEEAVRVLKPSGSLWVNLGDKYAERGGPARDGGVDGTLINHRAARPRRKGSRETGIQPKSLMGLPWRYALGCIDELGLILRAEVVWSKPNPTPESVTDRVRRSHEQWFHFTVNQRYFSALDEIREPHALASAKRAAAGFAANGRREAGLGPRAFHNSDWSEGYEVNPLGRIPGSVWDIPTQPLVVPAELGVDHFAAFPTELPRRIIEAFCPREVCTACGEGRRPVVEATYDCQGRTTNGPKNDARRPQNSLSMASGVRSVRSTQIVGYACPCCTEDWAPPTTRGIVLDPFSGTGTTAMVAHALGRVGIGVELSGDYCRLGRWRASDAAQRAKVRGEAFRRPEPQLDGQEALWSM